MKLKGLLSLALIVSLMMSPFYSLAQSYDNVIYRSFSPKKYASLVIDANSGTIMQKDNATKSRYPASLTKLMTIYLTFDALSKNKLKLTDTLTASKHAAVQPRMGLNLAPGERITVKNLLSSLVVVSANDSAVVLAEKIGGNEKNFAKLMNAKAKQLGMTGTNFTNASGLYNPRQVTTAMDMARLMISLKRDFPQYFGMLSQNQFSYKGQDYGCHSKLMKDYAWTKAAKTGFVNASGFNLVINASKDNKDIVAVVMGGNTAASRDNYMRSLLDESFKRMGSAKIRNSYASN